jgi:hypothetical protein
MDTTVVDNTASLELLNPIESEEQKVRTLKELQSSLKELREVYTNMQERLKQLEELAEYEDIIENAMNWVFLHCQVNEKGEFTVGEKIYTWTTFLKDVSTNKIDFTILEKHIVPKQ